MFSMAREVILWSRLCLAMSVFDSVIWNECFTAVN